MFKHISACETKYATPAKYYIGEKTVRYCIDSENLRLEVGYDKADGILSYLSRYVKNQSNNEESATITNDNFCIPIIWHN